MGQALAFFWPTQCWIKSLYNKIDPNGRDLKPSDITDTLNSVGFFQVLKKIEGRIKEIIARIKLKLNEEDLCF